MNKKQKKRELKQMRAARKAAKTQLKATKTVMAYTNNNSHEITGKTKKYLGITFVEVKVKPEAKENPTIHAKTWLNRAHIDKIVVKKTFPTIQFTDITTPKKS